MRVLQFIGSFHQGGSERQAVQLIRLLGREEGFEVRAATLDRRGVLLKEMEETGPGEIPEFRLDSFYDLNFLKQIRRCARHLKEQRIDLVHTHDFYTNIFGLLAARYAGVPVRIASKRETGGMRSGPQDRIEKFIFRLADAVTVNAGAVEEYLRKRGVPATKLEIIHNGLDLDRFRPAETDRGRICRELGLPEDEDIRFVTLVANLRHRVKNQSMLLRTAARLRDDHPRVRFVFAGEGERKRYLEGLAEKFGVAGATHFIDRCRIVPELLSVSYACVLTSTTEGFSNSILEYMAAGRPVVATDVGGAAEAVREGETGFLVASGDDAEMAARLDLLLRDPERAEAMGRAGRRRVEEKFSAVRQVERIAALYRRLAIGRISQNIDS